MNFLFRYFKNTNKNQFTTLKNEREDDQLKNFIQNHCATFREF